MTTNTQKINVKSALKYSLLPGILPRAKELGSSGFGYLSFLFACVYRAVKILPAHHPFVNPANIGTFGLMQVIKEASNHVHMGWKNIDQILVFFALLAAVAIMAIQFLLLIVALMTGKAFAAGGAPGFTSMFQTPNPVNDIAFMLLDLVFGIPSPGSGGAGPNLGFFGSSAIPTGSSPFHQGLHALFNFYNLALLLVAVLIFLYYAVVVVIETAQTGVPFGARFSKLYAPFRLVIAVGLLVPLNYGFNGSQYITLYAAKLGSSFATNGWLLYNATLLNPTGGQQTEMVGRPRVPTMDELVYFSSVYHACRQMYELWVPKYTGNGSGMRAGGKTIEPFVIVNGTAQNFLSYNYQQAKTDFNKTDMEVVLGELNTTEHANYAGGVRPYCGKIVISLSNDNPPYYTGPGSGGQQSPNTGVRQVEFNYFSLTQILLDPASSSFKEFVALGERAAYSNIIGSNRNACWKSGVLNDTSTCAQGYIFPNNSVFATPLHTTRSIIDTSTDTAYKDYLNRLDLTLNQQIQDRGWGGAGIWYNYIADINGAFTSAVYAMPNVKQYPEVMEFVKEEKQKQDQTGGLCELFEPNLSNGKVVDFQSTYDDEIARALNGTYKYFACEKANLETGSPQAAASSGTTNCPTNPTFSSGALVTGATAKGQESNPIISVMGLIFGINGLFELRSASCWDNNTGRPSINPLAQMSTLGRSLVENAIRSMGIAIGFSFGGGILSGINQSLGAGVQAASSMFVGIATIGLTIGFILYYILPFLPFIYFFFAVGSWVKSIFEAMVGAPLWALAHLNIEGDGLPGRAAMGGYFLIFEIFLRPIIIVFGLIAGMSVFTAMAGILNNIFDLVVLNTSGALPGGSTATVATSTVDSFRRGVIDQFFFTIMYAILLYMMGTASFKLIDSIPNGIMRWIGSGVSTFNDNKQDPTQGLTQYAAIGGSQISGQILGGINQAAGSVGGLGGSLIKSMKG